MLFIKRVSDTTQITAVDESTETEGSHHSLIGKEIPDGVMIYRIFGSFFFGAADKLESALKRLKQEPEVLILRMRKVLAMDATGLNLSLIHISRQAMGSTPLTGRTCPVKASSPIIMKWSNRSD